MVSPAAQAKTPVEWLIRPISRAISFSCASVVHSFRHRPPGPVTAGEPCWLDTGAPVPWCLHLHHHRLVWQAIPGVRTMRGLTVRSGPHDFWLATDQPPLFRGPPIVAGQVCCEATARPT
jgi:hypothetical protein